MKPQSQQAQPPLQPTQPKQGCTLGLTPLESREETVAGSASSEATSTESAKKLVVDFNENNCQTSIEQGLDVTLPESPIFSSDDGKKVPASADADAISQENY